MKIRAIIHVAIDKFYDNLRIIDFVATNTCFLAGNNTDGKYIAKANKVSFNNVKSPFCIPLFIEKMKGGQVVPVSDVTIKSIACGANHVVSSRCEDVRTVVSWVEAAD